MSRKRRVKSVSRRGETLPDTDKTRRHPQQPRPRTSSREMASRPRSICPDFDRLTQGEHREFRQRGAGRRGTGLGAVWLSPQGASPTVSQS